MDNKMIEGKIAPSLIKFTIPLLISAIFQQFYNLADTIIAGQYLGEVALGSIGASYSITMLFMAVAFGCNAGCSIVIGRLFGAKKYRNIKTAVGTTLITFLSLAVVLTVFGSVFSGNILKMIKTPELFYEDGKTYLNIYVFGLVFLFLYNACNGIFTALGDSRTPLYFLIGSSVLNIALDILFVAKFNMGVAGVAWATFITQGVASCVSFVFLLKRLKVLKIYAYVTENDIKEDYPLFSFGMLGKIAVVAVPSIVQQGVISVGNLLVQGIVNGFGDSVAAGFTAAVKLRTFALACFISASNAFATFCAQNMGAGRTDRVKKAFFLNLCMIWLITLPFVVLYVFNSESMISMFARDLSSEALKAGVDYLRIVSPFMFIIGIKANSDSVLKGSTKMIHFLISTLSDLVLRVGFAYVLSFPLAELGIWWAWPIGWVLATVISFVFYLTGIWYKPKKIRKKLRKVVV